MILPLPVKKNKFAVRVDNISTTDYYGQIMEEVMEAHEEALIAEYSSEKNDNEAEELVDIVTTCVTRLDIIDCYDWENESVELPENFWRYLEQKILEAHQQAVCADLLAEIVNNGGGAYADFTTYCWEGDLLGEVIMACIARLESLGYDETARQKIYAEVNEKNYSRGYFEA